jgi:2-phospho-L-lactate guanylyltransferase (CobY/MobA/RfbA family)
LHHGESTGAPAREDAPCSDGGHRSCDGLGVGVPRDTCQLSARIEGADVFIALDGVLAISPRDAVIWPQGQGDLGSRLERVLARALQDHAWAIALGSDSPGLPGSHIDGIVELLVDYDAVLGPSSDGGFYAIGVRRAAPRMLANVRWSTAHAAADAKAQLGASGFSVTTARDWFDVDTEQDLLRLEGLLQSGSVVAPATSVALGKLGR